MEKAFSNGLFQLPRYHKRAFAHNYHAPFIYHIILKKQVDCEVFGFVRGDARIQPGLPGCAYIEQTKLGQIIVKETVHLPKEFPFFQIYQYQMMPDHLHILLRVKEWIEMELDSYIEILKEHIAASYSKAIGREIPKDYIFQPGFCDKPLLLGRSLDGIFRYIRENPHRLAMRMQFPLFFTKARNLRIGDKEYEAYGNLFLFRNPDKDAVRISKKFSSEELSETTARWLTEASLGTVLVSPYISKAEKALRQQAEILGAKIILITHEAFGELFKPARHDFDLCSQGRLLIISLGLPPKTPLSRQLCNQMNELAAEIAKGNG